MDSLHRAGRKVGAGPRPGTTQASGSTQHLGERAAHVGCLIVVLTVAFSAHAWGLPYHIHTTWQGDARYSITVTWRTSSQTESLVEYGMAAGPPYQYTATGLSQPSNDPDTGWIHNVNLAGLLPGARYHYRCGSQSDWSQDLSFNTAPSDPDTPFTFAVFSDSQTNYATWGQCADATLLCEPELCLHGGDHVDSGANQGQWDLFFEEGEDLMEGVTVMHAIGNHEGNHPNYYDQFALPGVEDWYSFDYGNAHFIVLTTEKLKTGPQRDWLEDDLSSTSATWKFAIFHRPMYSSGYHGCEPGVREAWEDLFDQYHVDIVFSGHDHDYERTYPIFDGSVADSPEDGTIYIVAGGAGGNLRDRRTTNVWSAIFRKVNHFVLVTVTGSQLSMKARTFDQTVFDTLQISKSEPVPWIQWEVANGDNMENVLPGTEMWFEGDGYPDQQHTVLVVQTGAEISLWTLPSGAFDTLAGEAEDQTYTPGHDPGSGLEVNSVILWVPGLYEARLLDAEGMILAADIVNLVLIMPFSMDGPVCAAEGVLLLLARRRARKARPDRHLRSNS